MISPKVKIGLLVAIHVVCGLGLAWLIWPGLNRFAWPALYRFAYFGLIILGNADAALLAIWAGVSAARLGWRLIAVIVAIVYTDAADFIAFDFDYYSIFEQQWIFYLEKMAPVAIFGILSALRVIRVGLHLAQLESVPRPPKDHQFSIRHLLLATAVVAGVLGIGRAIDSVTEGDPELWRVVTYPLCQTLAQLATLWAVLGNGRPTLRLSAVLPMALVVGFITLIPDFKLHFIYLAMFGLQSVITAASLLVVRSCG